MALESPGTLDAEDLAAAAGAAGTAGDDTDSPEAEAAGAEEAEEVAEAFWSRVGGSVHLELGWAGAGPA